jgi:phenylpropionate dioxygenase-like ring-hydroxylating dioxygenase large terminal subunit
MSQLTEQLRPPETRGRASVARVPRAWYVAAFSRELRDKPIARTVLGIPLAVFRRSDGTPAAVLYRCPHRNAPLSEGAVAGDCVQCPYHGWEFEGAGACTKVPGLLSEAPSRGRRVLAFPAMERDGFVWVWTDSEHAPDREPFPFPLAGAEGYTTVRRMVEAEGTMHAVIENALDVPHTAYLHKGLYRGVAEPNEIEVVVRRETDHVEAEYIGEPRPEGVLGRFLSPSGGLVIHFDRFILPSIIQVEYSIGDDVHVMVTGACTPVDDFRTRLYADVKVRSRVPGWLIRLATPLGLRVFKQDADMLALQTDNIRRFGGEHFESTEIDVLGGHIWRLLRQAERGLEGESVEKRFKLRA